MAELVTIIGDGQMGLVLADALHERGVRARLWGPFPEDLESLHATRQSPARLPDFHLPESIEIVTDADAALHGATMLVNAIPAQFVRRVWSRFAPVLEAHTFVLSVTKGIENETLLRPTQIVADATGDRADAPTRPMAVLSGPTIAAELARRLPATMVAASTDPDLTRRAQDLFNVPWLRIYGNDDPVGVELAGATKNVIALAAGMVDGLGAGANAKSALLARGLVEISRLGAAMGAKIDTFFGIAGLGDLATTCFSPEGRNRSCGERLGRGENLQDILDASASIVEGVPTTRSVVELARKYDVEMPITRAVHAILFEGLAPGEAIRRLMSREPKFEQIA